MFPTKSKKTLRLTFRFQNTGSRIFKQNTVMTNACYLAMLLMLRSFSIDHRVKVEGIQKTPLKSIDLCLTLIS